MTFQIDTGEPQVRDTYRIDRVQELLDAVHDELGADPTQEQVDSLLVQYIIGELGQPKTAQTVRRRFVQYWPLIQPLAEREPEQFDSLILEMAEIIS